MDDLWWSLSVFVTVTNSSFSLNLFFRVISLSTKPRKNCLRTYLRLCLRFYLRFSASQTTNIFNNCFNLFTIFIAQIRFWRAYMVKYIKLYHLRLLSYSNAEVVTKLSHKKVVKQLNQKGAAKNEDDYILHYLLELACLLSLSNLKKIQRFLFTSSHLFKG